MTPTADLMKLVEEVRNAELFEDGCEADLHEAGIKTVAAAYMEGRQHACDELAAALTASCDARVGWREMPKGWRECRTFADLYACGVKGFLFPGFHDGVPESEIVAEVKKALEALERGDYTEVAFIGDDLPDLPEPYIADGDYHTNRAETDYYTKDQVLSFARATLNRYAKHFQRATPAQPKASDLPMNAPLSHDERTDAEQAYTLTAFDYNSAPVGSRDWTIYWRGWWHRAIIYKPAANPKASEGKAGGEVNWALVAEGLDYFEKAGDDGDKLYVAELRKAIATLTAPGDK